MNKTLKSIVVLTAIALMVALALAGVNSFTAPMIEEAEREATRQALSKVYPTEADFEAVSPSLYPSMPKGVNEIYKFTDGGCVVKVTVAGYAAGLVVMCGIDADGKIVGAECLASSETESVTKKAEYTYGEKFEGVDAGGISGVEAISGATYTTKGYKNALTTAMTVFSLVTGAESDSGENEAPDNSGDSGSDAETPGNGGSDTETPGNGGSGSGTPGDTDSSSGATGGADSSSGATGNNN